MPTLIFSAVQQLARGVETLAYSVTLFISKNHNFRKANGAFSKRQRIKKTYIYKGNALTAADARNILTQKKIKKQIARDIHKNWDRNERRPATMRYYSTYGKPGHNARTCQIEEEMFNIYNSK